MGMKEKQIKSILQQYVGGKEKITADRRIEYILKYSNTKKPFVLADFLKYLSTKIDISEIPQRNYETVGDLCKHIATYTGTKNDRSNQI